MAQFISEWYSIELFDLEQKINLLFRMNPIVTETEWDTIGWSPFLMGALGSPELSFNFQQSLLV
jgi:hypothetical protein